MISGGIFIVRQERLDDSKRARLIGAAVQEFTERGFEAASYNKIIERSGLSKGVVYYYFDNKEALLRTVLEDACGRFVQNMGFLKLPETQEEYWNIFLEYHRRAIKFFLENPVVTRLMFLEAAHNSKRTLDDVEVHKRALSCMEELLLRGQQLGTVRKDIPVEAIQKLMHAAGDILCSVVMKGHCCGESDEESMQRDITRFIEMMHDLSIRVLSPEEVQNVREFS